MNKILKQLNGQEIIFELIPSMSLSIMIAEWYYKLGSFSLECIAFLVTWLITGAVFHKLRMIIHSLTNKN